MDFAGGRDIGVFTQQVELVNLPDLVGHRKADRALVLDLYVFDVGIQVVEVGGELQFARPPQRAHHVHFAVRPGMSLHRPVQVGSKDGIEFELMKAEVDVGRPVLAQTNVAVDFQVCLFELGLSGDVQLCPLRHRVDGEVAGLFLVERQIVEMDGGVEGWLLQSARAIRSEIRARRSRPRGRSAARIPGSDRNCRP